MFVMLTDRAQLTMEFLRGISGKVRVANEALANASKSWRDDGLTKREQEYDDRHRVLIALEADVAARRRELAKRERSLRWYRWGWLLSLILVGAITFIAGFALGGGSQTQKRTVAGGQSSAKTVPIKEPEVAAVRSSSSEAAPATATESDDADARAESGRYRTGGKFDVGRYCLDKEKEGGVTFEQCLGTAALALRR
jgi:hypothetical protein